MIYTYICVKLFVYALYNLEVDVSAKHNKTDLLDLHFQYPRFIKLPSIKFPWRCRVS